MSELLPLAWLVVAIAASSAAGNYITARTGRKAIGWPLAVLLFIAMIAAGGAMAMA